MILSARVSYYKPRMQNAPSATAFWLINPCLCSGGPIPFYYFPFILSDAFNAAFSCNQKRVESREGKNHAKARNPRTGALCEARTQWPVLNSGLRGQDESLVGPMTMVTRE